MWHRQEVALHCWINSSQAFGHHHKLKDLMLLEQFKVSAPREVDFYLNECDVVSPRRPQSWTIVMKLPVDLRWESVWGGGELMRIGVRMVHMVRVEAGPGTRQDKKRV